MKKLKLVKTHGMLFENALNTTNEYYRLHNKAIIYKKPTPIQVVKVDYPDRTKAKITEELIIKFLQQPIIMGYIKENISIMKLKKQLVNLSHLLIFFLIR